MEWSKYCNGQDVLALNWEQTLHSVDPTFVKANACYRPTAVAAILVSPEFSLLNFYGSK